MQIGEWKLKQSDKKTEISMGITPSWQAIAYQVDPHTNTVVKYKKYVIKTPKATNTLIEEDFITKINLFIKTINKIA